MKNKKKSQKLIPLLFLATVIIQNSFAASSIVGKYSAAKQVLAMFASDKAACQENNGEWDGDDVSGICLFNAEDSAEIKLLAPNSYLLTVSVAGNNLNTCEFEGKGALVKNILTAKVKGSKCVVTAKFGNDLSILNNGECQEFCGMGATLDAVGLKK